MRLNDKHLMAFAMGSPRIDMKGFMRKRGAFNTSYQLRYFCLQGNLLFYFKDDKQPQKPVGVIILEHYRVEECSRVPEEKYFPFKLVFKGEDTRDYVFACEYEGERDKWFSALSQASYEFLSMKVAELKKKLREGSSQTEDASAVAVAASASDLLLSPARAASIGSSSARIRMDTTPKSPKPNRPPPPRAANTLSAPPSASNVQMNSHSAPPSSSSLAAPARPPAPSASASSPSAAAAAAGKKPALTDDDDDSYDSETEGRNHKSAADSDDSEAEA